MPLLTAYSNIQDLGWGKGLAAQVIEKTGLGTLFINVTVDSLLWGYEDELPCIKMARPEECGPPEDEKDIFEEEENGWDGEEWKRKRRSVESVEKAPAEIVDCKCEVGLLRDWDRTLKEPARIFHGGHDLARRGWLQEFDNSDKLGWWRGECDKVGGYDGGILPPDITTTQVLDIWISLVCRRSGVFITLLILYPSF